MKKIIIYSLLLSICLIGVISCNQKEILKERPKDFLTPSNSYVTPSDFVSALANIYLNIRSSYEGDPPTGQILGAGVDLTAYYSSWSPNPTPLFNWLTLNPDNSFVKNWWAKLYNWIGQANVVIDRANDPAAKWPSEADKNAIIGEAMFLRAWSYHFLADMWGGVPLVLHETTEPKFDYHRSSQDSVYQQCKKDLDFAIQWMPTIDQQPGGRAPRAAAYTLLSEIDICLKDYPGAVAATSAVINNPDFHLMTERFGVYKDFTFNGYSYQGPMKPWGDVYWDLFREGNFNWKTGNHEDIWNIEYDYTAKGGGGLDANSGGGNFNLERDWGGNYGWDQNDKNGVINWLRDTLGGRPVGWYFATKYSDSTIWEYKGDWNKDIRNSEYNIQREFYWTNPAGAFYGQQITADNIGDPSHLFRVLAPRWMKGITAVHHGAAVDPHSGKKHDNGRVYKDWYIMRLPDDYFLRAEAYYRMGNLQDAANDINAIRNRAHATPVSPSDVNLDLILDERARELLMEGFRLNNLMRMGKLTEYLMKYNPIVIQSGIQLDNHLNLLPIPESEIEANTGYKLKQNPGY